MASKTYTRGTKVAAAYRRALLAEEPRRVAGPAVSSPRRSTGFFASLSPEQKRMALQFRGDDSFRSAELEQNPQLQQYRRVDAESDAELMRA